MNSKIDKFIKDCVQDGAPREYVDIFINDLRGSLMCLVKLGILKKREDGLFKFSQYGKDRFYVLRGCLEAVLESVNLDD